jgi:hypothetical protein
MAIAFNGPYVLLKTRQRRAGREFRLQRCRICRLIKAAIAVEERPGSNHFTVVRAASRGSQGH